MVRLSACRGPGRLVMASSSSGSIWPRRQAQRITFFFPAGKRIVLLTTFRKQRQNERAQVARARQAMARCIEDHTVEGEAE